MKSCEGFVDSIKKLKENIVCNYYHRGEELKLEFERLTDSLWKDGNLAETDLTGLYGVYQFLVDEVCSIHSMENSQVNNELFKNCLNINDLKLKIQDGKRACSIYSFNHYDCEYYIIGDLHSDTISLRAILDRCDFFNKVLGDSGIRLVFLGDYIDRGKAHLKILEHILALKYLFPDNIYLLRGNHDGGYLIDGQVKLCVGKRDEEQNDDYFMLYIDNLVKINNTLNPDIISKFIEFFNSLCNIAFISHRDIDIMAVHGGIPRPRRDCPKCYSYIGSIFDLTNADIVDNINRTIIHNMMWSDPCGDGDDLREATGRFRFTMENFEEFRNMIGFDLLIRGHEAEEEGYKQHFKENLITIFSSGRVLSNSENINNETAYDHINPKVIKIKKDGRVLLQNL